MHDEQVARWAALLVENLRREYPTKIAHEMSGDHDARPPRVMTPVFCGCYDWHSAVHSHWALARLRRVASPEEPRSGDDPLGGRPEPASSPATADRQHGRASSERAREMRARIDAALEASITEDGCAAEVAYLSSRPGFEMPYGIAWLETLVAELALAGDADAARWRRRLDALDALAAQRFAAWAQRLPAPIRSGEHSQSAFAMSLVLDAARVRGQEALAATIASVAIAHHGRDRGAPLAFEPSAYDFLSPALGAASLMARVLDAGAFAAWLDGFCPDLGRRDALAPVLPADRGDGKLVHWDGLNLSRAWMLAAIARALPAGDERRLPLERRADEHGRAGVAALEAATYAGSHWLPSFAIYWLTGPLSAR